MNHSNHRQIIIDGLWRNNPALIQLLGLCPLLAVTNNAINGLGLGIATLATLLLSNALISLCRGFITEAIRLPVFVMIIATDVTIIDLLMHAYFYQLHQTLGIFIPLIVTNCIIIARAEAFASQQPLMQSINDGVMMSMGFTFVLVILGAFRELLGQGTLFSQAQLLFGGDFKGWHIIDFQNQTGFLLATLPPGAFIGLACLVALKQRLSQPRPKAAVQEQVITFQPNPRTSTHE